MKVEHHRDVAMENSRNEQSWALRARNQDLQWPATQVVPLPDGTTGSWIWKLRLVDSSWIQVTPKQLRTSSEGHRTVIGFMFSTLTYHMCSACLIKTYIRCSISCISFQRLFWTASLSLSFFFFWWRTLAHNLCTWPRGLRSKVLICKLSQLVFKWHDSSMLWSVLLLYHSLFLWSRSLSSHYGSRLGILVLSVALQSLLWHAWIPVHRNDCHKRIFLATMWFGFYSVFHWKRFKLAFWFKVVDSCRQDTSRCLVSFQLWLYL